MGFASLAKETCLTAKNFPNLEIDKDLREMIWPTRIAKLVGLMRIWKFVTYEIPNGRCVCVIVTFIQRRNEHAICILIIYAF